MSNDLIPQGTLLVTSSSRPKRVAFFVNIDETNDDELNQIIRFNVSIWGGRFNPIIPVRNNEIEEEWWNLLVAFDPDIIYSFFQLEEKLLKRINRLILPYEIIEIRPEDKDGVGKGHLIREFDIGALEIQQIPWYLWSTRSSLREPHFFYIKDHRENTSNVNFLLRNFGTLPAIMAMDLAFKDLPHQVIDAKDKSPKECLAWLLLRSEQAVLPISLCRVFAHIPYSLGYNNQAQGFHLVIGDSPLDIIYHWDRELISDSEWGRNGFWLSKDMGKDDVLLGQVCQWIQKTWWTCEQHKQGYVVSYSVDLEYLRELARRISELTYTHFEPVKRDPYQFFAMKVDSIKKYSPRQTEQVPLSENKGLIGFPKPEFAVDAHPQKGWMVDLEIQFHPERYTPWTNARPLWQLPKRLGLADSFFEPHRDSRIISEGFISCAVTNSAQIIGIRIPSDREVFWMYLEDRHINYRRKGEPKVTRRFYDLSTSDKGRYLRGMIQLFGNLFWCGHFFEDPFWREIFLYMAGRPNDDFTQRRDRAQGVIKEYLQGKGGSISLSKEGTETGELADLIARKLLFRDPDPQLVTKKFLRDRFGQLKSEGLKSPGKNQWWHADEKFDQWKEGELENLIDNQALLMGAELTCETCGSTLWYVIDEIKSKMICNGCRSGFSLKTEPTWSYRLNDLVKNALQKHGILAVLLAFYKASQFQPGMFLWLTCQEFFEKENNNPIAEIDLMYIAGQKFVIGEVKSDPSAFNKDDFEKLKIVAKELEPNEVIVAATGDKFPPEVFEQARALENELKHLEIEVKTIPLLL